MPTDVELDAAFLRLLVLVHSRNLTSQLSAPRIYFSKGLGTLLCHLGVGLSALLRDIGMCILESSPGRCHEPSNIGAESGSQVRLQLA
jgi:hypothetical protein